jgi:rare lipoprotein A
MTKSGLRSGALRSIVGLAMASLLTSTPASAVQVSSDPELQAVLQAVESFDDDDQVTAPADEQFQTVGEGVASYYGHELAGNRTASGERFNPGAMTAAHRTLPLGTKLRVTNKTNGRSVIVRVNDRGPFVGNRILDVSLAAAREIGMVRSGKAVVRIARLV